MLRIVFPKTFFPIPHLMRNSISSSYEITYSSTERPYIEGDLNDEEIKKLLYLILNIVENDMYDLIDSIRILDYNNENKYNFFEIKENLEKSWEIFTILVASQLIKKT